MIMACMEVEYSKHHLERHPFSLTPFPSNNLCPFLQMWMSVKQGTTTVTRYALLMMTVPCSTAHVRVDSPLGLMVTLALVYKPKRNNISLSPHFVSACMYTHDLPEKYTLPDHVTSHADVDECADDPDLLCESDVTGRECHNAPGSYQCLCPKGISVDEETEEMCL